jgi:hypothetical protein
VSGSEPDAGLRRIRHARERRHIAFVGRTSEISPLIRDIPLFDAKETKALYRTVVGPLRKHWIPRGTTGVTEFYSLGTAAYLDFCCSENPIEDYVKGSPRANKPLKKALGAMYERVRAGIEAEIGEPVRLTDRFALPGFHIFLGQAIYRASGAPVHFDQQYQYLPWGRKLDGVPPLSFTMPIALPKAGGGLDTWNVTPDDVTRMVQLGQEPDLDKVKETKFKSHHPYKLGTLSLHSGLLLHRLGRVDKIRDDDERITLQGHGVRINGTWILHW